MNALGKISSPPGAAPAGGDWILETMTASKAKGDRRWKIQKTWKAADSGCSWDKDHYK